MARPRPDQTGGRGRAFSPLPPQLEEVLVTTHKLSPSGSVVQASDLAWQGWPKDTALRGVIRRAEAPAAMDEIKNSVARGAFLAGKPLRHEERVKGGNAGDLVAILAPGHSAVAIAIEGGGEAADSSSILPNDRVDVLRVAHNKAASRGGDAILRKDKLVTNVRVLAIGQNARDKRGQSLRGGPDAGRWKTMRARAETVILAPKRRRPTVAGAARHAGCEQERPGHRHGRKTRARPPHRPRRRDRQMIGVPLAPGQSAPASRWVIQIKDAKSPLVLDWPTGTKSKKAAMLLMKSNTCSTKAKFRKAGII